LRRATRRPKNDVGRAGSVGQKVTPRGPTSSKGSADAGGGVV